MFDFSQLAGFSLASIIVILVPGADVFLLLKVSMNRGTRQGVLALLGIHLGNVIQAVVMISGLGILISRVPVALLVLKILGAIYLLFLAFQTIRSLVQTSKVPVEETTHTGLPEKKKSSKSPFLLGFLTNVTNPKVLLFFLAFFPQFLGQASSVPLQLTLLSGVFIVLAFLWELVIVIASAKVGAALKSRRFNSVMDIVCAVAFVVLAAMVLIS